jgi:hypothetical protein
MIRRVCSVVFCVVMAGVAMAGPKWEIGEESWMKLSFLGQVHGSYTEGLVDTTDIYLRRGRFILAGQIMDGATFFVETDMDNAGRNGIDDVSMDIQDIFVDLRVGETTHGVKVGLILLPFSFETHSSAASLLGLDYNSEVIKLSNTFVWRDYGAELHGAFGSKVAYAVGAFDGYSSPSTNPDSGIRMTGHVAYEIFGDVESGWFNSQDRMGQAGTYLSVGLGADYQEAASLKPLTDGKLLSEKDATALVADVQSGCTMSDGMDLVVNAAWYEWDNVRFEGSTAFLEAGLRKEKVMGTAKCSFQDPDDNASVTDYTLGVHYFMKGHNLRTGLEYRWGDSSDFVLAGIQFLL